MVIIMANFNQIVGHEQIIEHFQNSIRNQSVSHAYLLSGENGSGKMLLANAFAKTLQCEQGGINPCGTCKSCLQAESGNHPDIIYVTHEKLSISVDDIRSQVNQTIDIKPYSSKYKIYIINEASKMTEQAQNALLKTIEEPPAYAVILLLTENPGSLLQTILSRCVQLELKQVDKTKVTKYVAERLNISEEQASTAANFAQGNIGKAIRYASSESFLDNKNDVLRLLKQIDEMEIPDIISIIRHFGEHKAEINDTLDLMLLWYRDVLMFKATNDANILLYREEYRAISEQAKKRNYDNIENIIKAIQKAKIRLNANVNFDTAMELMLLTLRES